MRIPSGVTDQYIYFVAVDSADFTTRETGLTSFTVYRSRNGGAAAAMTTPTINETDTTNMPGVYELLLDEDMTIDAGDDSQEMVFHITQASMAPVTRTIELYRPKITAGNTLGVASDGDISGNLDGTVATVTTATNVTTVNGLAANVITAASINASALDGKGDWNIGKTGYSLTQTFPGNFADLSITATSGRVDVGSWLGTAVTTSATSLKPEVDTYSVSDDATAANNLESACDNYSATRGLSGTALPAAAAGAAGGLPTDSAGKTSFNDIAATAIVSDGAAITTSSGTVSSCNVTAWDSLALNSVNPLVVASGTSDSGTTTTMVDAARTEIDDHWNGAWILFGNGGSANNDGACRRITDFVAASDTITFEPAVLTGITTENYAIIPAAAVDLLAATQTSIDNIETDTADMQPKLGTPAVDISTDIATVDTVVDGIQTDLDNGTDGLGAIKAETALILADTADIQPNYATSAELAKVPKSDGAVSWNATALGAINTEVDTALDTTIAELGVGVPSSTPTVRTALMLLYMALRNQTKTQTSGTDALEIYNDAGTIICKKLLTDDGSDFTEAKMTSG